MLDTNKIYITMSGFSEIINNVDKPIGDNLKCKLKNLGWTNRAIKSFEKNILLSPNNI